MENDERFMRDRHRHVTRWACAEIQIAVKAGGLNLAKLTWL